MPTRRTPSYLLHQRSNQARVRIDGKDVYLGPYGSPESRERYDDLIAEWLARNGDVAQFALTVDDLALLYIKFAESYYRKPDGEPTAEVSSIRHALRPLIPPNTPFYDTGSRKLATQIVKRTQLAMGHCGAATLA